MNVIHGVNQVVVSLRKKISLHFMDRMNAIYKEQIVDISITTIDRGDFGAAVDSTVLCDTE